MFTLLEFNIDLDRFSADQTPTPTRLLNNCEELRVFDDLQNINPFEEGFRRAVEDSSNGFARDDNFLTAPSNQDTLHTPQILPQFDTRIVKSEPMSLPTQDEPENLTIPSTFDDTNKQLYRELEVSTSNCNDLKGNQRALPLLPKPSIIYAAPITTAPTIQMDLSRPNENVKDKLKNIILSNSESQIQKKRIKIEAVPTILIGTGPVIATPANLIANSNSNKFKITNNDTAQQDILVPKTSENGASNKRRTRGDRSEASNLKVERNRAAARRYR